MSQSEVLEILKGCLVDFEREMRCPICLSVCRDPTSLPCSHFYCTSCLDTYCRPGDDSCPICKQQFRRRETKQDDTLLELAFATRKLHDILTSDLDLPPLSQDVSKFTYPVYRPPLRAVSSSSSNSMPTRSTKREAAKRAIIKMVPDQKSKTKRVKKERRESDSPIHSQSSTKTADVSSEEAGGEGKEYWISVKRIRKEIYDLTGKHTRGQNATNLEWLERRLTEAKKDTKLPHENTTRRTPARQARVKRVKKCSRSTPGSPFLTRSAGAKRKTAPTYESKFKFGGGDIYALANSLEDDKSSSSSSPKCTHSKGIPVWDGSTPFPKRQESQASNKSKSRPASNRKKGKKAPPSAPFISPNRPRRQNKKTTHYCMVTTDPWNCPQCTFRNKALETECAICEYDRQVEFRSATKSTR